MRMLERAGKLIIHNKIISYLTHIKPHTDQIFEMNDKIVLQKTIKRSSLFATFV